MNPKITVERRRETVKLPEIQGERSQNVLGEYDGDCRRRISEEIGCRSRRATVIFGLNSWFAGIGLRTPERLLLVRADRIGDLMHVTPLLRSLREQHPTVLVDILARPPSMAVLDGNRAVNRVLDASQDDRQLISEIACGRYDSVVHLFPDKRLIRLCRDIEQSVRKGWISWPGKHRLVPIHRSKSEKSEALYNADLLKPLFPQLEVDPRPEIFPSNDARELAAKLMPVGRVLLNPGSGHPSGAWPAAKFAQVAKFLERSLGRAMVLWGPNDRATATQVAQLSGAELAPATSLLELAALCERASVVISNDTGPMHIAAAAGAPLVVIWDGSRVIRPRRWGHSFRENIVNFDPFDGSGDSPLERQSRLARIGVDEVAEAALRIALLSQERGKQ